MDKAELCGSLLTWVCRGRGQEQVWGRFSCTGAPALAGSTFPTWGWEDEEGRRPAGPLDSGLCTRPRHVAGLRGKNR